MDIAHLKDLLTARKAYLEQDLDRIEHRLDETPNPDFEEAATEREGDEVLERLGTAELTELKQVNAALGRIAAGTYGVCANCGADIAPARLEIVPYTQKCRKCA